MRPQNSTNLKNRVNKLHIPKTSPHLPLFEILSNSIHAIEEKRNTCEFIGEINVKIIRNGREDVLSQIRNINQYPISTFIVKDNGIGFDMENFKSFSELDSEKKASFGGKGIGRLICLKLFEKLIIDSYYKEDEEVKRRYFEYKKSLNGFDKYKEDIANDSLDTGSEITLYKIDSDYSKTLNPDIKEISREIISHFLIYFIQKIEPKIILFNQNNEKVNLTNLFEEEFESEIKKDEFKLGDFSFKIIISKSKKAKSHKFLYCAHNRIVKEEGVSKYISDFRYAILNSETREEFYFQISVLGEYLDNNVNEERTGFVFKHEEDEEDDNLDISLSKIRKACISKVEYLLKDLLSEIRKQKLENYYPIIKNEYPNYLGVLNFNKEKIERLPLGLTKEELDIELYEIEALWRVQVKKQGIELLEKKKDITTLEEYNKLYEKFLLEFNEVGQSDLIRYIIHRRSVIDLLEKLLELDQEGKFSNEDIVHSLFFPIRETDKSVMHEKQNLWLIDERLTFNTFLASDQLFKNVSELNSSSFERIDLIIKNNEVFDSAALFSENKKPFESFTILEFKKPGRDDYRHGDKKKDPIKQVRSYIEEIVVNKHTLKGRSYEANINTPFYCYIIADITNSLLGIIEYENFSPTADGKGYFKFYETKNSRSYIEILPFDKIILNAKQRNKILFDKLNLYI